MTAIWSQDVAHTNDHTPYSYYNQKQITTVKCHLQRHYHIGLTGHQTRSLVIIVIYPPLGLNSI